MRVLPLPAPSNLSISVLLITWWISNNIYAIDAERLFTRFQTPYLFIDLTFCQILFGACVAHLYLLYAPPAPSATSNGSSKTLSRPYLPFLISALHYLATLLTNVSYATLGSTTTLLWKLSEPASTALLNTLILKQSPTPLSLLGVLVTLLGVFRFSANNFSIPAFSPIILSNILFPLRNVCIKLLQPPDEHPPHSNSIHSPQKERNVETGAISRFATMLRQALPLAAGLLSLKLVIHGIDLNAVPYMLRNASLFTAYQLASFILLERLDALTHSLLNTLKRFTGILLSMIILATPLSVAHYQGIAATLAGFVVYLAGKRRQKLATTAIGVAVVAAFVAVGAITAAGNMFGSGVTKVSIDFRNDSIPEISTGDMVDAVREPSGGEYLVTLVNEYRKRRRSITYNSYDESKSDVGGNVGNLVWQYGAHVALPDFSQVSICESDKREECSVVAEKDGLMHVVYNPQANTLNPENLNTYRGLAKAILKDRAETLMVGVGVQMEFRQRSDDPEFNSSASITVTSDDYLHPNNTKFFLQEMEKSGGIMLTRGEFSVNVTRRAGFTRAYSIGCPSFWINEDVHLGKTLAQKYKAIAARRGDKSLKIAVNIKKMDGFHRQIIHIRDNYPNSRFYAQSIGDMFLLKNLNVPFERARFFTNVEDWIADLKEMDVGYGVRIHGNMIALGAGLPTFIAASDWRVLEMAMAMKIPYTTTYDPVFEKDLDIAKMIDKMSSFDGEAFDRNRCKIAKIYIKKFSRYGIRVRKHVTEVSKLC